MPTNDQLRDALATRQSQDSLGTIAAVFGVEWYDHRPSERLVGGLLKPGC